jgi:hypothetical protein
MYVPPGKFWLTARTQLSSSCETHAFQVDNQHVFSSHFQVPMVTTESGLQYKDIKVGQGPSPPVGFQVLTLTFVLLLSRQRYTPYCSCTGKF